MPEAKNQAAPKPRARTARTAAPKEPTPAAETADPTAETTAAETTAADTASPASTTSTANATSTASKAKAEPAKPAPASQKADESGNRLTVTIPLDGAVVGVAVKAATLPLTAARKVAQNRNGLPAYAAVGGLAVLGAVEWPVAAVGGLGLAALRRWGPLKPAAGQEPKKSA